MTHDRFLKWTLTNWSLVIRFIFPLLQGVGAMSISRRNLIRNAAAMGAGAILAPRRALAGAEDPYGGFRMGIQSYSLRHFDLDGTLSRLRELGLAWAEFFPGQMKVTTDAEKITHYRAKLKEYGVTLWAFGVQPFTPDHERNQREFEFAKAMGVKVITAYPTPDPATFESLSALTKEYGITIGIHNHGPEDKWYRTVDQVLKAVEKWPVAIGACVDTGHFVRADEDAVRAIRELGPRVHGVHLKDAKAANVFTLLGEGKLDVVATLKALKDVKFDGCLALEYEEKPENPMDDIKACLATVREAVKRL
jgi:sugar phosphate isomerase/epimerase